MIVAMHQNLGMMHRTKTDNDLPSKLCPWDLPSPGPQRPGILFWGIGKSDLSDLET